MSERVKTLTYILLGSFVLWYLLRQTNLGLAYSTDIAAIPQQLGVAEGLKSAIQFTK